MCIHTLTGMNAQLQHGKESNQPLFTFLFRQQFESVVHFPETPPRVFFQPAREQGNQQAREYFTLDEADPVCINRLLKSRALGAWASRAATNALSPDLGSHAHDLATERSRLLLFPKLVLRVASNLDPRFGGDDIVLVLINALDRA